MPGSSKRWRAGTPSGEPKAYPEKREAERAAWAARGVSKVESHLVVSQ
jgi:osmotically-inducible protein OsmY